MSPVSKLLPKIEFIKLSIEGLKYIICSQRSVRAAGKN